MARYRAGMEAPRFSLGLLTAAMAGACASTGQPGADCPSSPSASAVPSVMTSGPVVADAVALTTAESDLQPGATPASGMPVMAVRLRADGTTAVAQEQVAGMSEAAERARALRAGAEGELSVVVYAERGVAHARVDEALDELRRAGIVRIGIVLDQPPASGAPTAPAASPEGSLPEVAVQNVGLHVGGGPNDEASKAPFKQAIAAHFDDFRRCYTQVSKPGEGGVFGVDLRIGRDGGKAELQQHRTGMGGQEFRDCVLGVFSEVEFGKPPRGPTVISYSIRYTVGGE